LRNSHAISDVGGRTETLRVSPNKPFAQHVSRFWDLDVIAFCFQASQCVPKTRKDIEVRGCANVSFVRRKTKKRYRQLEIAARRGAQAVPTLKPTRESDAAIFQWNGLDSGRRYAAVDEGLGSA